MMTTNLNNLETFIPNKEIDYQSTDKKDFLLHRHVVLPYLLNLFDSIYGPGILTSSLRILDLGCGFSPLAWACKSSTDKRVANVEFLGIDINKDAISFLNNLYNF